MRRVWKAGLLLAVGAAGGGAALAVASVPDSNGVIHACVGVDQSGKPTTDTGPNIRIIDPTQGQTCDTTNAQGAPPSEANLSWNTIGRRGPQGARGPAITIAGGNTLTLAGGSVVTVGSSEGLTINTPTLTPKSNPIGTVKLDLGGSSVSFNLYSYSFPSTTSAGGGGGAGRGATKEIVVTKTLDKASTKLALFCANGKHIPKATITVRKAGGSQQPYLKITLDQVLVSSYQASSHSDTPTESVSLNFTKIVFEHQ